MTDFNKVLDVFLTDSFLDDFKASVKTDYKTVLLANKTKLKKLFDTFSKLGTDNKTVCDYLKTKFEIDITENDIKTLKRLVNTNKAVRASKEVKTETVKKEASKHFEVCLNKARQILTNKENSYDALKNSFRKLYNELSDEEKKNSEISEALKYCN